MSKVAVTVLMPVYNAAAHLREAIDSILSQTFTDFELLIINDGSGDQSEEIILSYSDPRIRYEKNPANLRLIATLNKGIQMANGKYIARMDADDVSLPDRLQVQYHFMENHPEVALCGSWYEMIGNKSGLVKCVATHNEIMMKMLYQSHLCHPTVILRKSALEQLAIKFDPAFLHAEDYEFFIRIGEKFKLACIEQVLVKYRVHANNISVQNRETQNQNSFLIKKALFKKLGTEVTKDEMELYRSIGQYEYQPTPGYLDKVRSLLESMAKNYTITGFFDPDFFQNYLSQLWFNVTYNIGTWRDYKSSFLSKHYQPDVITGIKFRLKSLRSA